MTVTKKDIQKRMLVKQTINAMNKQIEKLEKQKQAYIEAGKQAKQRGLTAQYNIAVSGLKMAIMQQKRVYEMKLNFEITSQMKDMAAMTVEFLNGMGTLSSDMMKLTKQKDFAKVQKQFAEAMTGLEMQTENLENFMEDTQDTFSSVYSVNDDDKKEIENLISAEASVGESTDELIEKELAELKKKMEG